MASTPRHVTFPRVLSGCRSPAATADAPDPTPCASYTSTSTGGSPRPAWPSFSKFQHTPSPAKPAPMMATRLEEVALAAGTMEQVLRRGWTKPQRNPAAIIPASIPASTPTQTPPALSQLSLSPRKLEKRESIPGALISVVGSAGQVRTEGRGRGGGPLLHRVERGADLACSLPPLPVVGPGAALFFSFSLSLSLSNLCLLRRRGPSLPLAQESVQVTAALGTGEEREGRCTEAVSRPLLHRRSSPISRGAAAFRGTRASAWPQRS